MTEGRLLILALQTLQDTLEVKGIEVRRVSGKLSREKGKEALACKLDLYIPGSILSQLESERRFRGAVSLAQEHIEKWQNDNPDASEEEIAEWQNRYISWTADDCKVDQGELAGAVLGHTNVKQDDSDKVETVTPADGAKQAAGGL